ncbi:MAG: DUF1761 domain-containing protein [Aeromicrobium sp.]
MNDLSILGVILASLAFFLIGALWYAVLFGRLWRADMGIGDDEVGSPQPLMFAGSLVCGLVIAVTLGLLIGDRGTACGVKVGAGTGFGIGAAILAQNAIYESRSVRFWAINAGYVVVGLAVMGAILGAFQAR